MTAPAQVSALTTLAGVSPRLRHAVFALIALLTLGNALGTAFSVYLVAYHPLLLVAISPEGRHVVLATPAVAPALLVLVGTLRRLLGVVGGFGLGALYGEAAVRWAEQRIPRFARIIRFFERAFARIGVVLVLLVPLPSIGVLAGASGARLYWVALAGALGQLTWMTLTVLFGEAVADWTKPVLAFLSRHVVEGTIVTVVLVGLQQLIAYQKRRAARAPDGSADG